LSHGTAVREESGVIRVLHGGEAEEASVVAQVEKETRFLDSLRCFAADTADTEQRLGAIAVGAIHFFGGESQYGLKQTNLRVANSELRGVNSYGKSA